MRSLLVMAFAAAAAYSQAVSFTLTSYAFEGVYDPVRGGCFAEVYGTFDNTGGLGPVGILGISPTNIVGIPHEDYRVIVDPVVDAFFFNPLQPGESYSGHLFSIGRLGNKPGSFNFKAGALYADFSFAAQSDEATFQVVPEPASIATLGLGLLAFRKKIKKQSASA